MENQEECKSCGALKAENCVCDYGEEKPKTYEIVTDDVPETGVHSIILTDNPEHGVPFKTFSLTTREKELALVKKFKNRFFQELAQRVMNGQRMKGVKIGTIDADAVEMARQATEALYEEWIVNAKD